MNRIMSGILVHELASVKDIVRLMKLESLIDDLVVTFDEIENTLQSAPVKPGNGINYCLIDDVFLTTVCLLFLVVIIVMYYMKRELIVSCLLSY